MWFKRRHNIYAPKLSVRAHLPWYQRWIWLPPLLLFVLALLWWAFGSGMESAGFNRNETHQELEQLQAQIKQLSVENQLLSKQLATTQQQLKIEQSSSQEIAKQLKTLNDENLRLQDDLAFFQSISSSERASLAIHRAKLERDKVSGEYVLRMLLVQNGKKEFDGRYQLIASVIRKGVKSNKELPALDGNSQQLKFKFYQRIEQSIRLPVDEQLESIQIRVFEQGNSNVQVRQNISLS